MSIRTFSSFLEIQLVGLPFVITQHLGVKGGDEICYSCMWGDLCDMIRAVCTVYAHEDELGGAGG